MNAIREVNNQDVQGLRTTWWSRKSYLQAKDEMLERLYKEKSVDKPVDGALGQFVRFCVVGTSNAVIDFGVLDMALALFPFRYAFMGICWHAVII